MHTVFPDYVKQKKIFFFKNQRIQRKILAPFTHTVFTGKVTINRSCVNRTFSEIPGNMFLQISWLHEITWLIWAVYKALLLYNEPFYLNTHKYYVNTMDIFDHFASKLFIALLHSSGLWLCNWILLSAFCVYKSKTFWLATNVILVESESTSYTIGRRMHGLKSDINQQDSFILFIFLCRIKCCTPEIRQGAGEL